MSWKFAYYGSDEPTLFRKVVINVFMSSMALFMYALVLADFIPSDAWFSLGRDLSIALTAALTLWLYWARYSGKIRSRGTKWQNVIGLSFLPVALFALCYLCILYGVPDLGTRLFGKQAVVTELVTTHVDSGPRGSSSLDDIFCKYHIEGPATRTAFFGRICTYGSIPGSSSTPTPLDLSGRGTWFGFHVADITRN